MRTKSLRDSIQRVLEAEAGISAYYRFAPANAKAPFVVFSLSMVSSSDNIEWYDMAVEFSDYRNADNSTIEDISDHVGEELDYFVSIDDNVNWFCYRLNNRVVESQDKNILRLRLNFEIKAIAATA